MSEAAPGASLDALLDEIFFSTPLLFVREFLRSAKQHSKHVRIGITIKEVRANLREAITSQQIGRPEVEDWFRAVEGWGKQHLYLLKVPRRARTHAQHLNTARLTTFLKKRGVLNPDISNPEPMSPHVLAEVQVDDVLARLTWRSHIIALERHEELDEVWDLDDGEYEFRAYRRIPKRSASRLIVRKPDGIVLFLIDVPIGEDHDAMHAAIRDVSNILLAPLSPETVHLARIVASLDEGAVAAFGPRARRPLSLGVAPTQARYRTDGARLEFKSTSESTGYTESEAVRHVRRAMQVERFEGEAGKFRLTFVGPHREAHDMIVSLNAFENRAFLFSRMTENEVLALVDQFLLFA
jgi:hypothetical protein